MKRPHLMIRKLSPFLVAGRRSVWLENITTSPRSPLGLKRSYDIEGVGLGIIAFLGKPTCVVERHEIQSKRVVYGSDSSGSDPVLYDEFLQKGNSEEHSQVCYCNGVESYRKGHEDYESIDVCQESSSDFLSSCHLCKKKLHGKDIYMYRGEKGFCSEECRAMKMNKDEKKEQCRSEVSRNVDASSSPFAGGKIFSAGIFVL